MEAKDTVMDDKEIKKNLAFIGVLTDARLIAKAQAEISFKAGANEVVEHLPKELFIADLPPQEGKPYSHLGCYILRWGKDSEPTVGFTRLRDDGGWQARLKEWH